MMATTTEITAADWLAVRTKVAERIRVNTTAQENTRTAVAEGLIASGYIDIDFVLAEIRAEFTPTDPAKVAGSNTEKDTK